ncbi:GAF and ANTAR domain-containing protein [Brachybacterium alimentarium]|uniref:GAF and ANTAR domain-containing protein n=1 Tax=Brachybacterium alimentarium TaxID=47845 RepID=UPI003FCFD15F
MSEAPTGNRIVSIAEDLLAHPIERTTPDRVVALAVEHVPGCSMASITLRSGGREVESPAASDPLAALLDSWQYESGDGPCLSALEDGSVRLSDDLRAETRWPHWSPRASEADVVSVLSLRLATPERVLGSLNMYARQTHVFTDDSVDIGAVYARIASGILFSAKQTSGLREALESRNVIGIAQGLLMNRYGLTRDQAFEVLRRRSQESQTKLRDLAADVVEQWDRLDSREPSRHV